VASWIPYRDDVHGGRNRRRFPRKVQDALNVLLGARGGKAEAHVDAMPLKKKLLKK